MRSVLAAAGSQRNSRSHKVGWSHRKAHLCDNTAALCVRRKIASGWGCQAPYDHALDGEGN